MASPSARTTQPNGLSNRANPCSTNSSQTAVPNLINSFTSVKTASHHAPPQGKAFTSILEASPRNLLHNDMGGLFDQTQSPGADRDLSMAEPFPVFVDRDGKSVTATAADFFSTKSFDYDYAPGYGSDLPSPGQAVQAQAPGQVFEGVLSNGAVRVVVTIQRPTGPGAARSFNVLVNAPAEGRPWWRAPGDGRHNTLCRGPAAHAQGPEPTPGPRPERQPAAGDPRRPQRWRHGGAHPVAGGSDSQPLTEARRQPEHTTAGPRPCAPGRRQRERSVWPVAPSLLCCIGVGG